MGVGGEGAGSHLEVCLLLPLPPLLLSFDRLLLLPLLLLLKPAAQVPGGFDGVLLRWWLFLLLDCLSPKERRRISSHRSLPLRPGDCSCSWSPWACWPSMQEEPELQLCDLSKCPPPLTSGSPVNWNENNMNFSPGLS